jgi:peptide-methionine (S)-S-oxide reductase
MKKRGKNINIYLTEGKADGIIKCTLANWTGVAYKIPRDLLKECTDRSDLKQSGVYFLFGASDENTDPVIYVGQAGVRKNGEGILNRLQEHKADQEKDFWSEAVVFTTSNNSFGPTEISYLENRFCALAKEAGRYKIKNGNEPSQGHVTEEKESELEEFIENAKIIRGVLDHKVFQPLVKTQTTEPIDSSSDNRETVFYIKSGGADAKAMLTSEGIVVLAGSVLRSSPSTSCASHIVKTRENYRQLIDKYNILQKDVLFKTPSGASNFVLLRNSSGYLEWKTEDGVTLGEYERRE